MVFLYIITLSKLWYQYLWLIKLGLAEGIKFIFENPKTYQQCRYYYAACSRYKFKISFTTVASSKKIENHKIFYQKTTLFKNDEFYFCYQSGPDNSN